MGDSLTMDGSLTIVSAAESRFSARSLVAIAAMMGVPAQHFELADNDSPLDLTSRLRDAGCGAVVLDSFVAARLRQTVPSPAAAFAGFDSVLIYGFAEPRAGGLAAWITAGALHDVAPVGDSSGYSISSIRPKLTRQFSGLSFTIAGQHHPLAFRASPRGAFEPLISAGGKPVLAVVNDSGRDLFLLCSSAVLDLHDTASVDKLPLDDYPRLLPWLIFIRHAFGDRCWHNPWPRANLIIDDPLLRPRYGFLSYDSLIDAMRLHRFATTVAFIPWNYRRSSRHTAQLFAANRDLLSLCVHGCDHTGGEFLSRDENLLRHKARTALARMNQHRDSTGVAFDPVMVFPQGGFSTAALRALAEEGYLCAVNSGVLPVDHEAGDLTVGDLLNSAVTAYDGVPVFRRHYPRSIAPFALDLFLGNPALIVEHHGYFKNGYDEVGDFMRRLNALEPRLSWEPLGQALCGTALYKKTGAATAQVRFHTHRVTLRNPFPARTTFSFSLRLSSTTSRAPLIRSEARIAYQLDGDVLSGEFELAAGAETTLEVISSHEHHVPRPAPGLRYGASVAARRYLSEFRDKYLARNERLLALSRKFVSSSARSTTPVANPDSPD
jgi:hypothetical protein